MKKLTLKLLAAAFFAGMALHSALAHGPSMPPPPCAPCESTPDNCCWCPDTNQLTC